MTDQSKQDLVNRYLDAYNAFDVDAMVETLHPEVEFENISGDEVTASASGRDEFRSMAEKAVEIFASRRQTVTSFTMHEDGRLTIEVEYEGELAQDLPGGMKAGERVQLTGESTFAFADGKIAEIVDKS